MKICVQLEYYQFNFSADDWSKYKYIFRVIIDVILGLLVKIHLLHNKNKQK